MTGVVDVVALASVVSSGVVAGGSLVLTYRGQKRQRQHEAALAFEGRAWEEKSKSLYNAIMWSRGLADSMKRPDTGSQVQALSRAAESFTYIVGSMEAYTSTGCRTAFSELRDALEDSGADGHLTWSVAQIRQAKEDAIDAQDFDAAARQRDKEIEAVAKAVQDYRYDASRIRMLAESVIEQARLDVQNSKPLQRRWWQKRDSA